MSSVLRKVSLICCLFCCLSAVTSAADDSTVYADIPKPELEFLFEATVTLDPPREVGTTRYGKRRIIGINGGTFHGPQLSGKVLSGGADWQTVRADGTADLVADYSLQTSDGEIIYVHNEGLRTATPEVLARLASGEDLPADAYYMRTAAKLEIAADSEYAWLNKAMIISTGMRKANSVVLHFYRIK